jgi:hypothetical protein
VPEEEKDSGLSLDVFRVEGNRGSDQFEEAAYRLPLDNVATDLRERGPVLGKPHLLIPRKKEGKDTREGFPRQLDQMSQWTVVVHAASLQVT